MVEQQVRDTKIKGSTKMICERHDQAYYKTNTRMRKAIASIIPINQPAVATFSCGRIIGPSTADVSTSTVFDATSYSPSTDTTWNS